MRIAMRKAQTLLLLALAGLVCLGAQEKEKREPGTVAVKLNYTGAGTVDDKHKIFVFLFDSPDFTQGGVMPIGSQAASSKNGTVTFPDITAATVYIAAA